MGITRDMTPQPYPLECVTENRSHFAVIGWTENDLPVVVKDSSHRDGVGHSPFVLDEPVRFRTPNMDVSITGEVETTVDGKVAAVVSGLTHDDSVKVTVTS